MMPNGNEESAKVNKTDENQNTRSDTKPSITRRNIFKSIGGGVVGLTGIGLVKGNNQTVGIVTERGKDWTVVKQVPKDWYDYTLRVDKEYDSFVELYKHRENVHAISINRSDSKISGMYKPQLKVVGKNLAAEKIPDEFNGVPVVKVDCPLTLVFDTDQACYNNGTVGSSMDGGWQAFGSGGYGTVACRVEKDNTRGMLTCNHMFNPCDGNIGKSAYNHDTWLGNVFANNRDMDWAIIKEESSVTFTDFIDETSQYNHTRQEVASYFTYDGLKQKMGDNELVWKVGTATGNPSGYIDDVNMGYYSGSRCADITGGVYVSTDEASKDSGGPIYDFTDSNKGDVSIISTTVGHFTCESTNDTTCEGSTIYHHALSSPAWKMAENHGVVFDT